MDLNDYESMERLMYITRIVNDYIDDHADRHPTVSNIVDNIMRMGLIYDGVSLERDEVSYVVELYRL